MRTCGAYIDYEYPLLHSYMYHRILASDRTCVCVCDVRVCVVCVRAWIDTADAYVRTYVKYRVLFCLPNGIRYRVWWKREKHNIRTHTRSRSSVKKALRTLYLNTWEQVKLSPNDKLHTDPASNAIINGNRSPLKCFVVASSPPSSSSSLRSLFHSILIQFTAAR